MNINGRVM
ncbi:hypothetical protein TIFTF001_056795 [Ficus carica]|uniref:Uncharacterized protein n=1 Tax=Ficus carica TaxID=3494 RepID=A0AA88JI07_FICCA|nr:hypothetical protein TIFTF001_056795 [Ficus carica]